MSLIARGSTDEPGSDNESLKAGCAVDKRLTATGNGVAVASDLPNADKIQCRLRGNLSLFVLACGGGKACE